MTGNEKSSRQDAAANRGTVAPSRFERRAERGIIAEFKGRRGETPPGRIYGEESLDASSDDTDRDDEGYSFKSGYESKMATRIGDEESGNPKAESLRRTHEGREGSDGEHSAREAERDKKRVSQAVCSSLPLATHETESVVNAVTSLDLDLFGNQKAIQKVTLGLVVVLVDEHHRSDADNLDQLVYRSDEFQEICDTHGVSMSDLKTIKRVAREQLEEQSISRTTGATRRDPAMPEQTQPDELPQQYWDELSAREWVTIAKDWRFQSYDFKNAIPDGYRETVDLLRRWQPWEDDEQAEEPSN